MKPLFARWLAVMLALCLFLSLAPAALTEEAPENAVFEEAEAVADEDVETQPDGDAADQEVVSEPVDAVPEEGEDIDLSDLPMFEAQSNDDELDLDALEAQPADDGEGAGLVSAAAGVAINKTNFPDDAFRAYVSERFDRYAYDDDGHRINGKDIKDGILDNNEIRDANYIELYHYDNSSGNVVGMGVQSLQGIKFFTNLRSLDCRHNELTTLDVSGCQSLEELYCFNNQLIKLDFSSCRSLKYLSCSNNQLTTLNVSGCPSLDTLRCYDNQLTTLDVSGCPSLKDLRFFNNQLTLLDISNCQNLIQEVNPNRFEQSDDKRTVYYGYFEQCSYLVCDASVQIIGGNPVKTWEDPSPDPDPAPAPDSPNEPTPDSDPTSSPVMAITAINITGKTTITAVPGTVYRLDLGGATGKKFKSSKKKVATVNAAGQVTVKGAGKTKITFKVGKKTRTVNLTVKDPTIPTSVMLSASSTAVKKGDVITLTPVIPEGTNTTFKWKSSNKKVATVSNGVVTFKKAGKVTITCTAVRGKKKVKVKFKVSN